MDIEEFEDLVDRWGEDLSQWPSPAREAGEQMLRCSQEAAAIVAEARKMRLALAPRAPVAAPAGLAQRIVARAAEGERLAGPAAGARRRIAFPAWLRGGSLAARFAVALPLCFLIGMIVSWNVSPRGEERHSDEIPTLFLGCCGAADAAHD